MSEIDLFPVWTPDTGVPPPPDYQGRPTVETSMTVIPAGIARLFYDECPRESGVWIFTDPCQRNALPVLFKRLELRGLYFRLRSDYGYGRGNLGC